MPALVCRIQWRKGLPLGLSVSPRRSFLELPRELRDKIYRYSLIESEPITVWSGTHGEDEEIPNPPGIFTLRSWKTVDTNVTTLDRSTLSLLWCNRKVACEAAATLYRWNTFHFVGGNNWNPLYAFLQMIGEENRYSLRSIKMQMCKPKQVWQHLDGTRTSLDSWLFREVIPPIEYMHRHSTPIVKGLVDNLDPAIEACFRILGKNRPALTLMLILDRHYLPGVEVLFDEQHPDRYRFSMDLPVMMETFRQDFTADSGTASRVEILWQGECLKDQFTDQTKLIQESGWEIMDVKEGHNLHDTYPVLTILFTLRIKKLPVASFPADDKASQVRGSWMDPASQPKTSGIVGGQSSAASDV